jgi:hypothetical protein
MNRAEFDEVNGGSFKFKEVVYAEGVSSSEFGAV